MHVFLNALAASAGGGLTYLRNVLPHLSRRGDIRVTVAVSPKLRQEFTSLPNISLEEMETSGGVVQRVWREQRGLRELLRKSGAEVLISTGNFALRDSPVPQILLSRNALYTSEDFYRDLFARREYGLWLETRAKAIFARKSIAWADCTVAPSQAFANELQRWTGRKIVAIHHGFDPKFFFDDQSLLPADAQQKLTADPGALRLLFVSHYNYYRNFETLFRALSLLRQEIKGRKVELFLTCQLQPGKNPGSYNPSKAAALVRELHLTENIVELGAVAYRHLHRVYRACHICVTPAYAETFAHPLVEAMASGLPVVASDLPVHREICGDAAAYFPRFSPEALAQEILRIGDSTATQKEMSGHGQMRSRDFSWERHVEAMVALAILNLNH